MRKVFKIGTKEYKYKKDAILHYRTILNSYDFGQSLNDSDYNEILDLLDYDYFNYLAGKVITESENEIEAFLEIEVDNEETTDGIFIEDVKVVKVQFNTKCFEIFYSDKSSAYISYLMIINNTKYTPEKLFYIACRNAVHSDIHSIKKDYFTTNSIGGKAICQETHILSSWIELVVDHRQPNTFSMIVERFKEINKIDFNTIEYTSNNQNYIIFLNDDLVQKFRDYHKDKASLRIVRKECNSSRTGLARIKRTNKDLTIN
jgi:hypothetical protein